MNKTFNIPTRQSGAALIVGLVLMMVLTLLAISTMRTSTLELTMAGNAQYHEQAKQLAETGIEDAINRINNDDLIPTPLIGWLMSYSENILKPGGDDLGRYDVTITYMECGDPPSGSSGGGMTKADFYEIESTGLSAARNAKSTLRQGVWILTSQCI